MLGRLAELPAIGSAAIRARFLDGGDLLPHGRYHQMGTKRVISDASG